MIIVRNFIIFFIIILCLQSAYSQDFGIYDSINKMPDSENKSLISVVRFIEKNSNSDMEKARGIYYWIANNIRYDVRSYFKDKQSCTKPTDVFEKRKGVCCGYSNLYSEMCKLSNIKCEKVSGYTYGGRYNRGEQFYESNHTWNVVKIDSVWRLVDATWGSGYIEKTFFRKRFKSSFNDKYFDSPPHIFILNHLPEVQMWQLLNYPITTKIFPLNDLGIYKFLEKKKTDYFNYNDTILLFYNKEYYDKIIDYGDMAIRFNPNNKTPLAFAMLEIVMKNINNKVYSPLSNIYILDSMINFTENSINLFKKSKAVKRSLIESIENSISLGYDVLAELNCIKAKHFEQKIIENNSLEIDSLKFIINSVTKPILTSIKILKLRENYIQLDNIQEKFCIISMNIYNTLYTSFDIETDTKKKRKIKKEITKLISIAKKNITEDCECKERINLIKTSDLEI